MSNFNISIFDFKEEKLKCKHCLRPVQYLFPDNDNIIDFQGVSYTSCMICESITTYNVWDTPQLCLPCQKQINQIIEENQKICVVCNKKGQIFKDKNGMLLCKIHRKTYSLKKQKS